MKLRKEKVSYYTNQPREKQNSLNVLLPNKKLHKTVNTPASDLKI